MYVERREEHKPARMERRRWLFWLMLLFLMVPLIELAIFIQIGQLIGTLETIAIIFLTGVVGAVLVRSQGAIVIYRITSSVRQGRLPANDVIEGLFVLIGGALLLTPGFFTDVIGILMLAPVTRALFRERLKQYLSRKVRSYIVKIDMGQNQ